MQNTPQFFPTPLCTSIPTTTATSEELPISSLLRAYRNYKTPVIEKLHSTTALMNASFHSYQEALSMHNRLRAAHHDCETNEQIMQNIINNHRPEIKKILQALTQPNPSQTVNKTIEQHLALIKKFLSLQSALISNRTQFLDAADHLTAQDKQIKFFYEQFLFAQRTKKALEQRLASIQLNEKILRNLLSINYRIECLTDIRSTAGTTSTASTTTSTNTASSTSTTIIENNPLTNLRDLILQKKIISDLNNSKIMGNSLLITSQNQNQQGLDSYSNLNNSYKKIASQKQQAQYLLASYQPETLQILSMLQNQPTEILNETFYSKLIKEFLFFQEALVLQQQQLQDITNEMVEKYKLLKELKQRMALAVYMMDDIKQKTQFKAQIEIKLESWLRHYLNTSIPSIAFKTVFNNLTPIFIQNITVTHAPLSLKTGEIQEPVTNSYLTRMAEQIKIYMELARSVHQRNCNEDHTLKISCFNNLTILSTDEFSGYPCEYLTEEKYKFLVKEIYAIVKAAPPNIVLFLSTYPVLVNKVLHNVAICAVSGPQPQLYHRSKIIPAPQDFNYGCQMLQIDPASIPLTTMQAIDLNETIKFDNHGTLVLIVSHGGVPLLCNIELCAEHYSQLGAHCLENKIKQAKQNQEIIPSQYTHILSSNIISVEEVNRYGIEYITLVDKNLCGIWLQQSGTVYERLHTVESYFTLQPVFGNSSCVTVHQPQVASLLPHSFFNQALENNLALVDQQLKQATGSLSL